jgi:hypothetical protein
MSTAGGGDPWGLALVLLVMGTAGVALAYRRWRELLSMRQGLVLAGARDAKIVGMSTVMGTIHGRLVRYLAQPRQKGSSGRTVVIALVPPRAAPVEMHLTPQKESDASLVERGLAIDLQVGEPLFDAAFVVEAAPAETVRALLDAPTRSALRGLLPCELHVAGGEVVLRKPAQLTEVAEVRSLAELVGGLAARLGSVALELEEKRLHAPRDGGAAYRGVTATEAVASQGDATASQELAQLHTVRQRRRAQNQTLVLTGAVIVAAIIGLIELLRYSQGR